MGKSLPVSEPQCLILSSEKGNGQIDGLGPFQLGYSRVHDAAVIHKLRPGEVSLWGGSLSSGVPVTLLDGPWASTVCLIHGLVVKDVHSLLPLRSYVASGKFLYISEPQFPHLANVHWNSYLSGVIASCR